MEFNEAYKRLDKLCGEVMHDERRLKAYIEAMECTPQGALRVSGWTEDLKKLKHYRWIRNRIAHDVGCTEDNLCKAEDAAWLENFHRRIMTQTDPLAQYLRVTRSFNRHTEAAVNKQPYKVDFLDLIMLLAVAAAVVAVIWCVRRFQGL